MSFATIPLDARAVATLRLFPLATSRLVALLSASVFDANVIEAQRLYVESMDGGWERLGGKGRGRRKIRESLLMSGVK